MKLSQDREDWLRGVLSALKLLPSFREMILLLFDLLIRVGLDMAIEAAASPIHLNSKSQWKSWILQQTKVSADNILRLYK